MMRSVAIWLGVLVAACAAAPPAVAPEDRPLSHNQRYTNADITIDAAGVISIFWDNRPDAAQIVRPGDAGFDDFVASAPGLYSGERVRLYISNGWYRRNADGSYTQEGFGAGGGAGVVSQRTISPGTPEHECMDMMLDPLEDEREYPFLAYDRDRIHACVFGGSEPPRPD